jgi:hypothetical protein
MGVQRWEVLTLIGNHWENVWEQDGNPWTFNSYEDAEAEILDHINDCRLAVKLGDMPDAPTRANFCIAPYVGTSEAA